MTELTSGVSAYAQQTAAILQKGVPCAGGPTTTTLTPIVGPTATPTGTTTAPASTATGTVAEWGQVCYSPPPFFLAEF